MRTLLGTIGTTSILIVRYGWAMLLIASVLAFIFCACKLMTTVHEMRIDVFGAPYAADDRRAKMWMVAVAITGLLAAIGAVML